MHFEKDEKQIRILRREIDRQTEKMLHALKKRLEAAEKIGKIKKRSKKKIKDKKREKQVLEKTAKYAKKIGLSQKTTKKLINYCISKSRQKQKSIKTKKHSK
ncbi:MAG: chorismate mutase [Candidatus Micrarchaeia archaeon]